MNDIEEQELANECVRLETYINCYIHSDVSDRAVLCVAMSLVKKIVFNQPHPKEATIKLIEIIKTWEREETQLAAERKKADRP